MAYWQKCQEAIAALPANIRVSLPGQLDNEEVMQKIGEAHVLYMTSVGENFGHSMLEGLCVGRPLLISDRTPWRGLEHDRAGWDLPLEEPERFRRVLQELTDMDDQAYQKLADGAFALGLRYLSDKSALEKCLAMFRK
jgi:glycosyltransferase involved in cell wall biosynthesis